MKSYNSIWMSLLVTIFLFLVNGIVWGQLLTDEPPRWIDPLGRHPSGYTEWRMTHPAGEPCRFEMVIPSEFDLSGYKRYPVNREIIGNFSTEKGKAQVVLVVVEENLYWDIPEDLQRFAMDLESEGYIPIVESWSGGSPEMLRGFITGIYNEYNLVGVLMVGSLPIAWWEDSYWEYEEFPIDYFFMELDGVWYDDDGDGIYDRLSGDVGPEIWTGRIIASNMTWGSPVELIHNYFEKDHAYRTGVSVLPNRGLSFVDDDWSYWGDCDLDRAYDHVKTINSNNQTTATNYKSALMDGYEWVHLCAHSCPWSSTFMINWGRPGGGSVVNCEIDAMGPRAFFYNLFNCSGTRYTEKNNIGVVYCLQDQYGLAVIGSSKTGSMLNFGDFYTPLGNGATIGDAYRQWWLDQALNGFSEDEQSWYFGMNILGDPTLHININAGAGSPPEAFSQPLQVEEGWNVVCVSDNQGSDCKPVITPAGEGEAWAIWESGRNVRLDIYASRFNGYEWGPTSPVNAFEYWDLHPAACTDSTGRVWIFWQNLLRDESKYQHEIYCSCRTDSQWSNPERVSGNLLNYSVEPQPVVSPDGTLFCVWSGWANLKSQIYSAQRIGSTWSEPVRLSDGSHDELQPTAAVMPNGETAVFWSSDISGDREIVWSINHNDYWTAPEPVVSIEGDDTNPKCAVSAEGDAVVVWMHAGEGGVSSIYSAHFTDGTWIPDSPVTMGVSDDVSPSVCGGLTDITCVWMHRVGLGWVLNTSGYDGSIGWSEPAAAVRGFNHCYDPVCAVLDGKPNILFAADPDGYWNIYHAFPETDKEDGVIFPQ